MSQLSVTQTDVMQDLAYLLGETSVPTSGTEDRQAFIQRSLERIYRFYEFPFSQALASVAITSGVGTLPTDARFAPQLDVRYVSGSSFDDAVFEAIPYEEQDNYFQGSNKYWLLHESDGDKTINTKETYDTLTVRYSLQAPVINASIATPFPSSMVIAKGALIYYRQAEDPLADTSVEENNFMTELNEVIRSYKRNAPRRRMISRAELGGNYTGQTYSDQYTDPNTARGY